MSNPFHFVKHTWFLVLAVGLIVFVGLDVVLIVTRNLNMLPAVIVLGATLVPVTFVVYMYQRVRAQNVPVVMIAVTVFLGGALGLVVAGALEYATIQELGVFQLLGVSGIEESAKLIVPVAIYLRGHYRSEADGLLFGVASGMGFASLESMGYGLTAFLGSEGSITALQTTLIVRALIAPVGHAAWTGLVCAVIWRERERAGRRVLNWQVASAFLVAIALHTAWNTAGSLTGVAEAAWVGYGIIGLIMVGAISLILLIQRMREAGLRHPAHVTV